MPPNKRAQKAAAARARAAKYQKKEVEVEVSSDAAIERPEPDGNHEPDIECTGWTGGVNYVPSDTDSDDEEWKETDLDLDDESDGPGNDGGGDLEDLEGEDLLDGLRNELELLQQELKDLEKPTPYEHVLRKTTAKEWKKAEAKRGLGYNGQSARRKREIAQQLCEKEEQDKVVRQRVVPKVPALPPVPSSQESSANTRYEEVADGVVDHNANAIFRGYLSDILSEGEDIEWADSDHEDDSLDPVNHPLSTRNIIPPPKPKRRKLDTPARTAREQAKQARSQESKDALLDIEKLLTSKKTHFIAGANGLQSKRARSIQTCLHMVVNNKRHLINASECAAESQGFAVKWGGRMVRQWVKIWIKSRELPKSKRGCHKKVFSLLDDPEVQTELRSYIRTNKWSMNPRKLSDLTKNKLIPDEAKKYLHNVVETEMPTGLKKYLELELLPRLQMKVSKGVSLRTAPQSNDDEKMSWVLDGEQPLKKKGVGRGLHQSDVICSTKGWLPEASQTLEYGKNYDGYWNGELFVKQLAERIIPAFERAHGPSYQALIMVDNSQGHSAYSVDALLTSRMNMKPGGKQAKMRDGWHVERARKRVRE
ncbi:hypothetical protein EDB84DRAFT_1626781 [Lactarius hengduanensis]|nr:hypothetical protein EDB84DRAFT_1626781 [Lactarius hengduanensis]